MKQLKQYFDKEYKTKFEILNTSVIFSDELQIYIRSCDSLENLATEKMQLEVLVSNNEDESLTWIKEGYLETLGKYFAVYS